jgi:hypothetical protein
MLEKLLVALAIVIGLIRLFMPFHPLSLPGTYEAVAHLFVGILIGVLLPKLNRKVAIYTIVALTAVEVVCALKGNQCSVF